MIARTLTAISALWIAAAVVMTFVKNDYAASFFVAGAIAYNIAASIVAAIDRNDRR